MTALDSSIASGAKGRDDAAARDELWNASFATYFDCYYNENLADKLIDRWQRVDEISKVIVACTTSGSAVAGWALWNQQGFKYLWTGLASVAAVLSVIHTSLGVATRLRDWISVRRSFSSLRIDMETFRYKMKVNDVFDVDGFTVEFTEYRKRYADAISRLTNDTLLTQSLRLRSQKEITAKLVQEGRVQNGN